MSYVNPQEVLAIAGITSEQVPLTTVDMLITNSEAEVDKFTNTTYWVKKGYGTASSGSSSTLVDSTKSWDDNSLVGYYLLISSGTGAGQTREITGNTSTTLTLDEPLITTPDATSVYEIHYVGKDPRISELTDGNSRDTMFVKEYPLMGLEAVSIDGTDITLSTIYKYPSSGKLVLSNESETRYFTGTNPQQISFTYSHGLKIPNEVKAYVLTCSALRVLQTQMGGTHNIPSTYTLPEGSVTIGQAYINIKGTWDTLTKERIRLEQNLVIYCAIA